MDIQTIVLPILAIIITEALLSVDNVLVIVALASTLPPEQQKKARFIGIIILGIGLRLIALRCASLILQREFILYIGAAYLIWLAFDHFFIKKKTKESQTKSSSFWRVVLSIGFADLVFSIDNVVAACGLSTNIYLVWVGVVAGIIVMFFAANLVAGIVKKYPQLIDGAFLIVGVIGVIMISEHIFHFYCNEKIKFAVIVLIIIFCIFYKKRNKSLK